MSPQTLADYRGNYKYNLLDANLRQFNAEVPTFAQWDDHEVTNDWWPGQMPRRTMPTPTRRCSRRAGAARSANSCRSRQTLAETGRIYRKIVLRPAARRVPARHAQLSRAERRPARRGATPQAAHSSARRRWPGSSGSLMALDRDLEGDRRRPADRIWSARTPSRKATARRSGASSRSPICCRFIKHAGVRNTVWITADMHYTAAHYYDPNRAVFQDFEPFWEFVSGPLHAGHLGAGRRSTTRSVRARCSRKACSAEQGENLAPCFGLQFFGHVAIDGATEVMTVTLKDVADRDLWSVNLLPQSPRVSSSTGSSRAWQSRPVGAG